MEELAKACMGIEPSADEFLLVGKLRTDVEKVVTHASALIRLERNNMKGQSKPIVVHLDCNCARPQCTKPHLLRQDINCEKLSWRKRFG
jgi:hypothetical protein